MEHQYERGESPWELLQQLTETDELLELYGIVYGHEELLDDDVLADLHAQVAQAPERRRGRLGERLAMLEAILEQGIYQYFLGAFGDENPAKARRLMGLLTTEEPTQKAAMVQASPDLMDDETVWLLDLMLSAQDDESAKWHRAVFITLSLVLQMRGEGERTNLHPAEMEEEPRVLALPGAEELMAAFFVSELPGDLRGHLALGEKLLALLGQVEAPYITAAVHQLRAQLYLQLDGGQEASPDYDAAIDATRAAADAFKGTPYTGDRASLLFDLGELLHHDKGPDRGQHLEEAIAVLQEAASIFTREAKADRWAYLQLSLATAYRDRQTGDGQENLQAARRHLEEALDTFIDLPEESFDTRIVAVAAWNRAMLLHEMLQAGLPGVTEQEWRVADAFARQYPNPWLEAMGEG